MRLGVLTEKQGQNGKPFISGEICTYAMRLGFILVENKDRQKDESPTHLIYATGKHGGQFHAGVAWIGQTKDGDPMYSMIFTVSELFDGEMRFMAWQDEPMKYRIEESKPQQQVA